MEEPQPIEQPFEKETMAGVGVEEARPSPGFEASCPICYEEFSEVLFKKRQRIHVKECGHEFCLECLAVHCKLAIQEKRIPVPCPETAGCGQHFLKEEFVRELMTKTKTQQSPCYKPPMNTSSIFQPLSDEIEVTKEQTNFPPISLTRTFSTKSLSSKASSLPSQCSRQSEASSVSVASSFLSVSSLPRYWSKYQRFQRLKEDPNLLPCPNCGELVSPPLMVSPTNEGDVEMALDNTDDENFFDPPQVSTYPHVKCPSCRHCFCSVHGDAHFGLTCEEFAHTERGKDLAENEQAVLAMTKPCSHGCGARIARISGCDHMICTHCNQDMCWKCGTHVFLYGGVIRSCSNCRQGFVDHRRYNEYRIRLLFVLPFHLALAVVWFGLVAVAFVLTCGFGCCFGCGTRGWQFEPTSDTKELRPKKGLEMTGYAICLPMVEMWRDCGFMPHNDGLDRD